MDDGLVLIATVLVLGGLIATLGDRIGMRVGNARLSLFNLRPRQTATVVSNLKKPRPIYLGLAPT